MIYLITGTPGTGKTSMALSWVLDNKFDLFRDTNGNLRPIFAVNIPNINKKVLPINDLSAEEFLAKPLHDNFEVGSVIFVDEASEIYPNRSAASKLPAHVDGLNKLRHYGLTLILITQSPQMIDPFVRNLVGKHVHIERKQLGSKMYEWNTCQTSFSATTFGNAYSQVYKPDKRTFDLYKSSSKHIEFKKSISWYFYALPILPVIVVGLYWLAYQKLDEQAGQPASTEQVVQTQQHPTTAPDEQSMLVKYGGMTKTATEQRNMSAADFVPTVADRPESAPIYNDVRRVVDMPDIAMCVSSANSCNCYTHQGTLLDDISDSGCRKRALNREFNPYKPRDTSRQDVVTSASGQWSRDGGGTTL